MVSPSESGSSKLERAKNDTKPKDGTWVANIDDKITADVRHLLENYSKVPPHDVVKHVYDIREKAWAIRPWRYTGSGIWLKPLLPQCPIYDELITRTRAGATFMDIGCFLGHDLRHLVVDGAPSANLYAVDEVSHWEIGYDFFRDRSSFAAQFIEADILRPNAELRQLWGTIDAISIVHVLHIWDYETQREVAQNIAQLSSRPGAVVVGFQLGTAGTDPFTDPYNPQAFRHTPESFQRMWNEAGAATATSWESQAQLWPIDLLGPPRETERLRADARILQFVVTRKEAP